MGDQKWRGIVCPSFEPRSIAVPMWLSNVKPVEKHFLLKINDPPSKYSEELNRRTDLHELEISTLLKQSFEKREADLLSEISTCDQLARDVATPGASLLLDISAMPKRVFLFLVKRLMSFSSLRDLVVCYTPPESYREGSLSEHALPPDALPGYARVANHEGQPIVVVSVGYMAYNLGDLLEQSGGKELKFLFPFPPGSPSFRRNWRLLHELVPSIPIQTQIRRIHAMDMFAALDWLSTLRNRTMGAVDLIPLGPKPHALAMALAHRRIGDSAELLYSQPRVYHPEYSSGIRMTQSGRPDITAYCLRREFKNYV